MEDNTIIAEATAHTNSKNLESKMPTTAAAVAYDPDDYMYDYEDDFYYYDKCFSCKNWLENECGAPNGKCSYEPF